ncbi:MAG: hypothetical protein SFY69_12360 [Planctomycetota bacterium]|nr:hypothetical protein [Planctomycetota bacterium]
MDTPGTPRPATPPGALGGIVHSYQRYDPTSFPSPTQPPPDMASAAFEHLLTYGSLRHLTDEELANAVRLDPSMIPTLGPSLESIRAMLEERKRKILARYDPAPARDEARAGARDASEGADPPAKFRDAFRRAVREEQLGDLERLWYAQKDERSPFALDLLRTMERLAEVYQIEEMIAKHAFTGREALDVPGALRVKEELDAIDTLLEQIRQAEKNAQVGIIDAEDLAEFLDPGQMEQFNQLAEMVRDAIRERARAQGLEFTREGYQLTPRAYSIFQKKLLREIFADLQAARSGRHGAVAQGEGVVELERTRAYEFGDPVSALDVPRTIANAAARHRPGRAFRPNLDDVEIHITRNSPKCATAVLLDMSGSMRYAGQYVNAKRMALALDGLIRTEYPGDFLAFFEMYSIAKRRPVAELPTLMPKPVSIGAPVVRLKADLSDPGTSERSLPQHFTNIQHALRLARQTLAVQDTPNRQIVLITDGLPTAHFEDSILYLLYPPDPRTEQATMREAAQCAREGITINIFLLPSWSQDSDDVQFAHRLVESTSGRVFFTGGTDLDRFVLWDYVARRRRIIG